MTFGQRIIQRRKALGLSQRQLAERAGVSKNTIQNCEQESCEASLFTASCIAVALGVSLDYLAGLSNNPAITLNTEIRSELLDIEKPLRELLKEIKKLRGSIV